MFLTDIDDYDHRPYVRGGFIQDGLVINENWIFWLDVESSIVYGCPPGFVHDLASRPALVEFYISKLGRSQRSASMHDIWYVYQVNSKRWSDLQYHAGCIEDGVVNRKGWAMRIALTIGGWHAWWSEDKRFFVLLEGLERGAEPPVVSDPERIAYFEMWIRGVSYKDAFNYSDFVMNANL